MNIALITSTADAASMSMGRALGEEKLPENVILHQTDKKPILFDEADDLDAAILIFLSKHFSKHGEPAYTCHATGNWDEKAEVGGTPRKLSVAPALLIRKMLLALEHHKKERDIFQEVTHHGPTTQTPSLFVEIGSREDEWKDVANARKVIDALLPVISELVSYESYDRYIEATQGEIKVAIGIGGLHHTPRFRKVLTTHAFSHICPKHMLTSLDEEMLVQALERTVEDVDEVLLDWKGLKREKRRIVALLEALKLSYNKIKDVRI